MTSTKKLIANKAECRACGDTIKSTHRHDWVCCTCFKNEPDNTGIFIDGGLSYVRVGGAIGNYMDRCEYEE